LKRSLNIPSNASESKLSDCCREISRVYEHIQRASLESESDSDIQDNCESDSDDSCPAESASNKLTDTDNINGMPSSTDTSLMPNMDTCESEEDDEVHARLEQALAAINKLMTFAGIPSSRRAMKMIGCSTPFPILLRHTELPASKAASPHCEGCRLQ
jgi:hypothetical protein